MRPLSRKQALGLAAAIAVVVAVLVYLVLHNQTAPVQPEVRQVSVVQASVDIPAFETVTGEMVTTAAVDESVAPIDHLSDISQAVGRISQRTIAAGENIARRDVAVRDAAHGLTYVIPDGMRAATVAIDPVSGVAGFMLPGDRVDVLTTFKREDAAFTRTILQDVEVLAIGEATTRPQTASAVTDAPAEGDQAAAGGEQQAPKAQNTVTNATLAVAPDEAQQLILAASTGSIHLVLRPVDDTAMVSLAAHADWELMGIDAPAEKTPEKPTQEEPPQQAMTTAAGGGPPMVWGYQGQPPPQMPDISPGSAAGGNEATRPQPATVEVVRGNEREVVTVQ